MKGSLSEELPLTQPSPRPSEDGISTCESAVDGTDAKPSAGRKWDTWRTAAIVALISAVVIGLAFFCFHNHLAGPPAGESVAAAAAESKVALAGCHSALPGEMCHDKVTWAMIRGIHRYPMKYGGLTAASSFKDFQAYFYRSRYGDCPMPCGMTSTAPVATPVVPSTAPARAPNSGGFVPQACLCIFDIDRTLTGKQGAVSQCPGNKVVPGVVDPAFQGGEMVLSALGQAISTTFCGGCYLGLVSAGAGGGPAEKLVLENHLRGASAAPTWWSGPGVVVSPLVTGCSNPEKALCASGIVAWYRMNRHVDIHPTEVYFFDDLTGNTAGFAALGYNARQVSCGSRDGEVGLCGATPGEIVREHGIKNCW